MIAGLPPPSVAALLAAVPLLPPAWAHAQIGGNEGAAIRAIFPDGETIEATDLLLTDEMVKRIEALARARVKERLVTAEVPR